MSSVVIRVVWLWYDSAFPRITIHDHERAVRYHRGIVTGVVGPGLIRYRRATTELSLLDMRESSIIAPGQEVLSADALGFKFTLHATYRIKDPVLAVSVVESYRSTLYLEIQAAARSVAESMTVDEILAQRSSIGDRMKVIVAESSPRYGIEITKMTVRDCMLPGNLKQIFVKVAEAKQEGLAALERARGVSAALRNLANAARLMENNPRLALLRLLQTLEKASSQNLVMLPADLLRTANLSKSEDPTDDQES